MTITSRLRRIVLVLATALLASSCADDAARVFRSPEFWYMGPIALVIVGVVLVIVLVASFFNK
jgi:hypothetical protein